MTTPNLITTKNGSVEASKKQKLKDPNVWLIQKFPDVYLDTICLSKQPTRESLKS